jgi:signal transduction histidine kinase
MSEIKEYHNENKTEEVKKLEIELRDTIQELEIKNQELESYNEELKNTIIELDKARIEAEKSDKMKSIFLANMSHEIRTPMNSILGFSEILLNNGFNRRQTKKYLIIINKNGEQLLKLINDIIDLSKIQVGELKLEESTFSVDEFCDEIYENFSVNSQLIKKDIKLLYNMPEELDDIYITTDRERLKQVMNNLIGNSIKFTEKGRIEYGCDIIGEDKLKIYVKDTGIGLDEKNKYEIFNQFVQINSKEYSKKEGTGLGLSISKGIIELLGGKIFIESEINKGTTISFTIPVKISKEVFINEKTNENYDYNFYDKNILVAEDIEDNFNLIKEMILPTNCIIQWAKDGKEAIELYNKYDFDIILLDMRMPVMSGYEVLEIIRKENKEIPIISQTAYAFADDKKKLIDKGCNDYISKPINRKELLNLISKYL